MFDFFDVDELRIVQGSADDLLSQLDTGDIQTNRIAGVALVHGPDVVQLFPVDFLEDLLDRQLRGEDVVAEIRSYPDAEIVARMPPAHVSGIVLEQGTIAGAWLTSPPPSARPRRRRRYRGISLDNAPEPPTADYDDGDETIRRTPHIDAPMAIATAPGTSFTVEVYTSKRVFGESEEGEDVEISAPPDIDHVDLNVFLVVSDHFEVQGTASGLLTVERDVERSQTLTFTLAVVDAAPNRMAGIQAVFLFKGRPCGHVGRAWDWHGDHREALAAAAQPEAAVSLPVHTAADQPDLSVIVVAPVADGTHYQCTVATPLIPGYDGSTWSPWGVPSGRKDYVDMLLGAITDEGRTDRERLRALAEAGYEIWDAAPPAFQKVLWALVDDGKRPKSIYIASAEPTLPWELMIPTRHDGKVPDELEPLGVEFAIGRWTRGDTTSPPPTAPVRNAYVVAPRYSDDRALDAAGEIEFVENRLNGQLVSPATIDHLDDWFEVNDASLLHFVCHGAADVEDDDALISTMTRSCGRARSEHCAG